MAPGGGEAATASGGGGPLLEVRDLRVRFGADAAPLWAVNGMSFRLGRGEVLALVGESGAGKSLTAWTLLGLPPPGATIDSGAVLLDGRDLLQASSREMRGVRGGRIGFIPQDPLAGLNPVLPVGAQVAEVVRAHGGTAGRAARAEVAELFEQVGLRDPAGTLRAYPHELSGGERQRVMIAQALAGRPDILVADEPTTALDVTVQAQVLDLVRRLQAELGMAVLWITHDLAVVSRLAHRVAVAYAGRVVEEAPARTLYRRPRHPYTRGLLDSVPRLTGDAPKALKPIPGQPPDPRALPAGCPFAPRCSRRTPGCGEGVPLGEVAADHRVACIRPEEPA